VALVDQLGDAVRLHGYAILVVLDFLGDSYDQCGHIGLLRGDVGWIGMMMWISWLEEPGSKSVRPTAAPKRR
jgi:hypothetical protein